MVEEVGMMVWGGVGLGLGLGLASARGGRARREDLVLRFFCVFWRVFFSFLVVSFLCFSLCLPHLLRLLH